MKIAHFAVFAPHSHGLYHTVHDLILAERAVGIDAQFIDFAHDGKMESREGMTNREITTVPMSWYKEADIVVSHSAVPKIVWSTKKCMLALHGRPEASFRLEFQNVKPIMTTVRDRVRQHGYKAIITFWQEYLFTWSHILLGHRISYIPSPVDFNFYRPDGKKHEFKNPGSPNIMIADMWREDVTPFELVIAAQYFKEKFYPDAKLHIFGVTKNTGFNYMAAFQTNKGVLGEVSGVIENIDEMYRAADMIITPNIISTRIIRESLASGLPVVAPVGCKYTPYTAEPRDHKAFAEAMKQCWEKKHDKEEIRKFAFSKFNPSIVGNAMKKLCEEIVPAKKMWDGAELSPIVSPLLNADATEKKIKMAIVYDPLDSKMRPDTYSYMFKGMFEALIEKFNPIHVTADCNADEIDANVILFWDGNSCHHIKIEGIDKHAALKLEYLSDPFQVEQHGIYKRSNQKVHKLSAQQRIERLFSRGVSYILSSNKESYYRRFTQYLGARADSMLWFFPHAPWFESGKDPLASRKPEVLANGSLGHEIYRFREWAFKRPNITVKDHWGVDQTMPMGKQYPAYLKQWAASLGLCDEFPVPKYYEILHAGCLAFLQYHKECEELGFKDMESCVYVNQENFDKRIKDFLNDIPSYQKIADAGRKLMEEKYTAQHYADFVEKKISAVLNIKPKE